jgi:hypothetical protein
MRRDGAVKKDPARETWRGSLISCAVTPMGCDGGARRERLGGGEDCSPPREERQREAETLSLSVSIGASGEHGCPAWTLNPDRFTESTKNPLRDTSIESIATSITVPLGSASKLDGAKMSAMSRALCVLITSALSSLLSNSAQAMTIHVPADAPTIQAGVNLAAPGDTVEVACGTYTAGAVLKGGIVIRSETGLPGCVTIDVVGGAEAFRAIDLSQGVVIVGFRMTAPPGSARGMVFEKSNVIVRDCEVVGFESESMIGMGLSMDDASTVTVDRCLFEDNTGLIGGGIDCTSSTLTMTDCVMRRNKAHLGGAVDLEYSKLTILNCDFIENEASHSDQGTSAGGAIRNEDTTAPVTISDCVFENNFADIGGCIVSRDAYGREPTSITNSVFRGNDSFNGGSVLYDVYDYASFGGVYSIVDCIFMENDPYVLIEAQVQLRKSLFLRNRGECVRAIGASTIESCTFVQNTASSGPVIRSFSQLPFLMSSSIVAFSGDGMFPVKCTSESIVTVECCDFYGNGGGDWVDCVAGQENANGNLSADPLFCAQGDFTIHENSPCAPSNSGNCGLIGALGVGCGAVSVESKTWGQIKGLYR